MDDTSTRDEDLDENLDAPAVPNEWDEAPASAVRELIEPELAPLETGEYAVDAALSRLEELRGVPVAEHVAIFDGVHQSLQAALADLDGR